MIAFLVLETFMVGTFWRWISSPSMCSSKAS